MDSVDVHDLPEDQAQVIAAFVEFLRQRRQEQAARESGAVEEAPRVGVWDLGVKQPLMRREIYGKR